MKTKFQILVGVSVILVFLSGCASYYAQKVGPTPIMRAEQEIPEDQLLDVGILVFKSEELSEEKAEDHRLPQRPDGGVGDAA